MEDGNGYQKGHETVAHQGANLPLHGALLGYLMHFNEFTGDLHVICLEQVRVVTVQHIFGLNAKDRFRRFVDGADMSLRIYRNHTGGNIAKNNFHVPAPSFDLFAAEFQFKVGFFQGGLADL